MGGPDRRRVATIVLLVALGSACGGSGQANVVAPAREPRPTRSTAAPERPPTFDTVPAPVVLDRGDDYAEIARSLLAYGCWLEWHHPDPALVERAYAPGSAIAHGMVAEVREARREHKRMIEADAAPYEFRVLSVGERVVSLRATEHLARRELVTTSGRVLAHVGPRTEHYVVSILRARADAPWRLNYVKRLGPRLEVQLSSAEGSGELDDARLGVGIETNEGGVAGVGVPVDARSPSLPRLVHYVSTPLPPGRPGELANICNASDAPGGVQFGWLYEVVAYSIDGRVLSDTRVCVPFPDPNDQSAPPPAPTLPEAPTVGDVWRAVTLPRPVVGANPVTRGVTGLDTRLWSGGPQTAQVAVAIGGFRITGVARVVGYRFATDEGFLAASAGPGDEANPAATHRFARKGPHSLSVASVWQATVTMTAIGGAPVAVPIDIDTAVLTATVDYPVVEVRSKLVA